MKKNVLETSAPQYAKIYYELRNEIINYILTPNSPMPSESSLMERFGVSRHTIRHAIDMLANEKLVIKKQGKATIINPILSQDSQILHIGCLNPPHILLTDYTYFFAKKITELTHGQIQVQIHHSSKLGNGSEHINKLITGEIDMFCAAIDWLAEVDKIWELINFPFLFDNIEHLKKFVKNPILNSIKETLSEKHNLRIIADNWYRPSRILLSNSPLLMPEQIKNLKIGIPSIPLYNEIWKAIGANPIEINFSERKKAFIDKEIDITDVNWDIIISEGLDTVAKYAIISNHQFSRAAIIMNNNKFNKLRKDIQENIIQAAEITGKEYSKHIFSKYQEHKKILLNNNVVFIEFSNKIWQNIIHNILLKHYPKNSQEILLYKTIKSL